MQPDGIVLMGPFGSGKSHLGRALDARGIARFTNMEPILYDRFEVDGAFQTDAASKYLRTFYLDELNADGVAAFESTGITQRPLLLEITERFTVPLVRLTTPKEVCIARVGSRNANATRPIDLKKAVEFYDHWISEVAPQYEFMLEIDGSHEEKAIDALQRLVQGRT